jgi:tRNA dimethylallyltransferase
MRRAFFLVGPTATGKSELAADVALEVGAEIVSADAFQIYRGLDLLTAKPEAFTLSKAPHHLIGMTPLDEEMNAERYRRAAECAIEQINSRSKLAIVVGGSGLYIKALTHGLAPLPESDPNLRQTLDALSFTELRSRLCKFDPRTAEKIDLKNRRRIVRALEICLLTGKPASAQREQWVANARDACVTGIVVLRDREELYARINQRVEIMFERGVIEQVRNAGVTSATASQMIGLREIRQLLAEKKSLAQCIAEIQQATRRYAKRQLTWFRRQSNFSSLDLSSLTHNEAVKYILLRLHSEFGPRDD